MDDAKGKGREFIGSAKYGGRVRSGNGGKTWRAHIYSQGKRTELGSHPTEEQAATALSKALYKAAQDSSGLPQLSDAEKEQLDAISMEQLLNGFKAAGRVFSRGTSCYRGVSWDKAAGKWVARIRSEGHNKGLGMFTSEEEAARVYDRAALAKLGRDAVTNFPAEQYYADGSFAPTSQSASECLMAASPSPGKESTKTFMTSRERPPPVVPWPAPTGVIEGSGSGELGEAQQQDMSAGHGVSRSVSVVPAASASNAVLTLSEEPTPATDGIQGHNAPDWESWGDGGALNGINAMDSQAGAYNAMHWAADSDDEADDELEDAFPGMTQQDREEYMASGRLEPNLHIFTNPLYPPYETDLEHAQQTSWLAFLAAKDSTDPAVWNAADAAGKNLLRAYAEADTSDDDEDSEAQATDSAHGLANAPPVVLKPGSGWHQINGNWIRRVALPGNEQFQGFGPDTAPGAVAEMSPMSNVYNTDEPTPKKIKTGMESTNGYNDANHSAGDIVAKVKELTGKMAEIVALYKEGELPFWVVEAESAHMQADFDAFMGCPQRDYSEPPSDGAGRVSQAEMLELERGEEAARDPNAVITQAGRYRIRTATNGDSAILL